MKQWFLCLAFITAANGLVAGHGEWFGYPLKDKVYKFEVYSGEIDRWDSSHLDNPPLSQGKALQKAKEFIKRVPLPETMQAWRVRKLTLQQLSADPGEWIYLVHFAGQPLGDWNGPVPWIDVPVRFDGSIPTPKISEK